MEHISSTDNTDPITKSSPGFKFDFSKLTEKIKVFVTEQGKLISADAIGWVGILCLHGATLPSLLALMSGLTDDIPPVDIILMLWTGLLLMFIKAAIQKDMTNLITISVGFMIQASMMILIFFK